MHLVRQHILDVNCSSEVLGREIQTHVSSVLEKEFYPELEKLFDQYAPEDQIWMIENLEIEISEISQKNWKEDIVRKSLEQIEYFLKLKDLKRIDLKISEKPAESRTLSFPEFAEKLFLDYLKKGRVTDNSVFFNLKEIISKIEVSDMFFIKILNIFKDKKETILRWIFSVPEDFKDKVYRFSGFNKEFLNKIKTLLIDFRKENSAETERFSEFLSLMFFLSNKGFSYSELFAFVNNSSSKYWNFKSKEISDFIFKFNQKVTENQIVINREEYSFMENWKDSISEKIENMADDFKEKTSDNEGELIYIENGGLVILHPFLQRLFESLELTEKNEWKSENDAQKAVLLLHFLVYGDSDFSEDQIVLNKIICGLKSDEVINVNIQLNDDEKEACEELLNAVVQHWSVMSNSSVSALRETFLQRNAKLILNKEDFELYVEEKGFDVLLNGLPWGISTIRTAWMNKVLFCHWNY
ncbi:contractile injection system tape measure protein [Chryseobacterium sp.]|uniref:contractile injection system tape measure protein n=1 Tax=Chryseobacterium sp. TaxID=1871047 RepID=UPI0028A17CDD|nr:contractile injection system tape measure protein [Chryseobacterium sp.]